MQRRQDAQEIKGKRRRPGEGREMGLDARAAGRLVGIGVCENIVINALGEPRMNRRALTLPLFLRDRRGVFVIEKTCFFGVVGISVVWGCLRGFVSLHV